MSAWSPTPRRNWPWRDYLTEPEAALVRRHDEEMAAIEAMRLKVTDIRLIQNRAIQRAKYHALKKVSPGEPDAA